MTDYFKKPQPTVGEAAHKVVQKQPMPPAVAKLGFKGPGGKPAGRTRLGAWQGHRRLTAMTLRACVTCGKPSEQSRCLEHRLPNRKRRYFDNARVVRANATVCALCGHGPRLDDPWVADHITPRARGGTDELDNLQAAHRSCNGRRGAKTTW